jgi:hypothetical protein
MHFCGSNFGGEYNAEAFVKNLNCSAWLAKNVGEEKTVRLGNKCHFVGK